MNEFCQPFYFVQNYFMLFKVSFDFLFFPTTPQPPETPHFRFLEVMMESI